MANTNMDTGFCYNKHHFRPFPVYGNVENWDLYSLGKGSPDTNDQTHFTHCILTWRLWSVKVYCIRTCVWLFCSLVGSVVWSELHNVTRIHWHVLNCSANPPISFDTDLHMDVWFLVPHLQSVTLHSCKTVDITTFTVLNAPFTTHRRYLSWCSVLTKRDFSISLSDVRYVDDVVANLANTAR